MTFYIGLMKGNRKERSAKFFSLVWLDGKNKKENIYFIFYFLLVHVRMTG